MATDLDPSQQANAIAMQLQGQARDLTRDLPTEVLLHGGVIDNVQVGPVEYLMRVLQARFAPMGEEIAIQAIGELMGFHRNNGESID